jgi:hypothetical protein
MDEWTRAEWHGVLFIGPQSSGERCHSEVGASAWVIANRKRGQSASRRSKPVLKYYFVIVLHNYKTSYLKQNEFGHEMT